MPARQYMKPELVYVGGEFFAGNVSHKPQDISIAGVDDVTLCASPYKYIL